MKETVPAQPSSSGNHSPHDSHVEQYQVDNISTTSHEGVDNELDTYVVASDRNLPIIESVAIVNSNDVHIGNKTVYHGPVTIKQIVYPSSDATSSHTVEKCEGDVTVKVNSFHVSDGIDNPTFLKDCSLPNEVDADKDIVQNNNIQQLTGNEKGYLWLRHPKKHRTYIVILFFILVIIIIVCITLIHWGESVPSSVGSSSKGDTDEQENNTPVDYSSDSNSTINDRLRLYHRLQWLAQPPTHEAVKLKTPVPLVIIQHTATENCSAFSKCVYHVRYIQQFHIESNQWWDIGYNFLVGGDGAAYEGRGWIYEGAHTLGYNYKSIGVAFIGTFSSYVPPPNQIAAFKLLVAKGVELGYIQKDYKILAARQLYATESPGAAFMKEIKTWPHWAEQP